MVDKSGFSLVVRFRLGLQPIWVGEFNPIRVRNTNQFGSNFGLDRIQNSSQDFGLDSNSGDNLFQNLIQFQNESIPPRQRLKFQNQTPAQLQMQK